ncbi:hypothetical protein HZR84_11670 [Hyphobacterium sp. CCMP332]|nr:hypothetical protein HZR84_11670 [Hyphobacterium sp. CCMP332]
MKIFRNILSLVVGWLAGSIVNMGLIQLGHNIFPIEGIDINDMDALASVMPNLEMKFFIFPFLAHAIGTLVGAAVAYLIAASHKMKFVYSVGGLFLLGGILAGIMLNSPTWYNAIDFIFAYIPMAWLGGKIAEKIQS